MPPRNNILSFLDPMAGRVQTPRDSIEDHQAARGGNGTTMADQFGDRTMSPSAYAGEYGIIMQSDAETNCYKVNSNRAGELKAVPRIMQDPNEKSLLPEGTVVAITRDYGRAMILGVLPMTGGIEDNDKKLNLTGDYTTGGNDQLDTGKKHGNYRTQNTPRDLGAGDWAKVGPEGNAVAVLGGGVNLMKSGMAQVQTHAINDFLQLICQNFKHHTAMGTSEVKNNGGRCSWTFRGGVDQLTESGSDQDNWTVRVDLGGEGDMFNFELTRPNGSTIFKFHVNGDGKVEIFGAEGVDLSGGNTHTQKHLRDREVVVKDKDVQVIGGDQTKTIESNKTTNVASNITETAGNDRTVSCVRHETKTVGGRCEEKIVGGNSAVATPGDISKETTINNGTWKIDIGDPLAGSSIASKGGYDLTTYYGDIKNTVKYKGDISYTTTVGNIEMITRLGTTNIDGSVAVRLGNKALAIQPLLKGIIHNTAKASWLTTRMAPMTAYISLTQTLAGLVMPPLTIVYAIPVVGPIVFFLLVAPIWMAKLQAEMATATAHLAADTALQTALPTFLSTKSYTE
jgi:hypothetical protein